MYTNVHCRKHALQAVRFYMNTMTFFQTCMSHMTVMTQCNICCEHIHVSTSHFTRTK